MQTNILQFKKHSDYAGILFSVSAAGSEKNATLFIRDNISASSFFGEPLKNFTNSLDDFSERTSEKIDKLSSKGWLEVAIKESTPLVSCFKTLRDITLKRKVDLISRRGDFLKPLKPIDPARAAEIRQMLKTQKTAELVKLATENPEFASAVLDFKSLYTFQKEIWMLIEDTVIEQNLQERFSKLSELKPTLENILPVGPDLVLAKEQTKEAVKNLKFWMSEVLEVESILQRTVQYYALVTEVGLTTAFSNMIGKS